MNRMLRTSTIDRGRVRQRARRIIAGLFAAVAGCWVPAGLLQAAEQSDRSANRPNVLFICIDDLRPELGCYGVDGVHSPHLDRFAKTARLFRRHYVQVPTCGASRYALWTGRRPATAASHGNGAFAQLSQQRPAEPATLPERFRRAGYLTLSHGKVSHSPDGRRFAADTTTTELRGDGKPEMPHAWDKVDGPRGPWTTAWRAFFAYEGGKSRTPGKTPQYEAADVDDNGYPDGLIADAAVGRLEQLAQSEQPFFYAVGFFKPHLPFNAPQKYWDLYDRESIPPAPSPAHPKNVDPRISLHSGGEMLGNYGGMARVGFGGVSEDDARTLRHGYRAAVSYVDAQVGKVLSALDRLGLRESTIVVIWGDHGWHLGDNGVWGKHTLMERSLRSVLLIRTPDMKQPGQATDAVVETVDLYPTLAGLCGLPPGRDCQGTDLTPVLDDPNQPSDGEALGYWRRGNRWGQTLRTERYRVTRYRTGMDEGEPLQVELYDHQNDPEESVNIAAQQPRLVESLLRRLDACGP